MQMAAPPEVCCETGESSDSQWDARACSRAMFCRCCCRPGGTRTPRTLFLWPRACSPSSTCRPPGRRAEGVARTYWLLFVAALAVFGIANLIWLGETTLRFPGSLQHALLFFYRLYAAPLAMTLLLRRYQVGAGFTREAGLDFLQVGILGWLIFFALFYLPAQSLSLADTRFRASSGSAMRSISCC